MAADIKQASTYLYEVDIEGTILLAKEVTGLSTSVEISDHNVGCGSAGYINQPTPGPRKPEAVTIVMPVTDDMTMFNWFKEVSPKSGMGGTITLKACTISFLDGEQNPTQTYALEDAFIREWSLSGVDVGDSSILLEKVVLTSKYLERTK
ncbi:MAG: phage tail protein [Thermosynechococcaceae cyanobacterium]